MSRHILGGSFKVLAPHMGGARPQALYHDTERKHCNLMLKCIKNPLNSETKIFTGVQNVCSNENYNCVVLIQCTYIRLTKRQTMSCNYAKVPKDKSG